MIKYEDSISMLIESFPEMRSEYQKDQLYYFGLPYIFYESVFRQYIVRIISEENAEVIGTVFNFIEELLQDGDEKINDLVAIAILEGLFFEEGVAKIDACSKSFFGRLTNEMWIGLKSFYL
ncbi:hypothetical protein G7062_08020 [Erysipelothrix sp. HDW6C]|uniref:DUF7674 family protein n=1 Tax=Erysipelothrix sp. HDW6C TaxID=2714930 RepID=UPI001407C33A|nr:hypothetical protein [Erysipelothrix sp. HDW6C]QIK70240.1 hypothetical protein G7062_08020 [Erysipelothrix sp. HDW6C]